MKKNLIMALLFVIVFGFSNDAHAVELNSDAYKQSVEQKEKETIYFDENKDILITDNVIIRRISDTPDLSAKYNDDESGMIIAGAGEWDLIGDEFVGSRSSVYASHGGDYRLVINQTEFGPYLYSLREEDPIFYDVVENFNFSGKGIYEVVFRNISGYCDGDDGLAEFYLQKLTLTNIYDYVQFWD